MRAVLLVSLSILGCNLPSPVSEAQAATSASPGCDPNRALSGSGPRRLALVVGVGDYGSSTIPDIKGARGDAEAMYRILTDPAYGYGFPAENVCLLRDTDATLAAFKRGVVDGLIGRARPGDTVVLYFSGHGAQVPDDNREEPDDKDEVLVLHDTLVGGAPPLRDDTLHGWLSELHAKTTNVTILLDACTSGSVMRAFGPQEKRVVLTPPSGAPAPVGQGDGDYFADADLAGFTILAAARDGTFALDPGTGGRGYFTAALLESLGAARSQPLTWGQVGRSVAARTDVLSGHLQAPVAQGALDRLVFDGASRKRAAAWEVRRAGTNVDLEGVALPGWGVGAQLRVFDGAATPADVADVGKAKAILLVDTYDGVRATARKIATLPGAPAVRSGDIAVIALPAPDSYRLDVGIDATVPVATRDALTRAVAARPELASALRLGSSGAFRLVLTASGALALQGPEGAVRNLFSGGGAQVITDVARALELHARQQALLALHGEPGSRLADDQTIEVRVQRLDQQPGCARAGWVQACPNATQQLPLCTNWKLQVRNTDPTQTLRVGGLLLSNDGSIGALPPNGERLDLPPRSSWTDIPGAAYRAVPPIDAAERVLLFGTTPDVSIDWARIGEPIKAGDSASSLERRLREFLIGGAKAVTTTSSGTASWTVSSLTLETVATVTTKLEQGEAGATCDASAKEYTLPSFDVRPYTPADPNAPFARVIAKAEELVRLRTTDGVPYLQHDWSQGSDAANLKKGIDCSRAIWYAFTRAGLPYSAPKGADTQPYLATAQMFDSAKGSCNTSMTPQSTKLHENFEDCLGKPFETGDVLVWQGRRPTTNECVGHTVMVIDPEKYIGWGSHGWDGSTSDAGVRLNDTGVEYQRILAKTWAKWDRKEYELKACWRHKEFAAAPPNPLLYSQQFDCADPQHCGLN